MQQNAQKQKQKLQREVVDSHEKLEKKADVNLDHLWQETQKRFEKITNRKLDGTNLGILVDQEVERILAIEELPDDPEEEHHTFFNSKTLKKGFQKAKKVFKTVFQVLWKFSGFLMPAVSTIPIIGSGMSFLSQAIQILIDTTKNYRAIFAKAAELFEQVGFFSMRFEMLLEAEKDGATVNEKFVQFLNVILAHTVDCVALYIKITRNAEIAIGDGSKIRDMKEYMKYAGRVSGQFLKTMGTDDDGEIGVHLTKLRSLVLRPPVQSVNRLSNVEEEHKLSSALVLSTVLKIHTNVIAVRGQVESMHSILGEVKNLLGPSKTNEIKKLLGLSDDTWNSRLQNCADRRIAETGGWLLKHNDFAAWLSSSNDSSQLLAIEADSAYGKTFLATAAILHIRKHAEQAQKLDIVAFYLFDKSSKNLTFGDIVRAIIFQLCIQSSQFFADADTLIQKLCGRLEQTHAVELWRQIIVHVAAKITDTICFIVLDGVEHLDQHMYQYLRTALEAATEAGPSLRILLTGNVASLDDIFRTVKSPSRIALSPHLNREDIELVATHGLAECDFFQDGNNEEMRRYMIDVRDRLVQTVSGDYWILSARIDSMNQIRSRDEVEEVLSRENGHRLRIVGANLLEIARKSSERDLEQLKEALYLLAILDRLDIPMPQLPVVQQYITRHGGSSSISGTTIATTYSSLLVLDDHERIGLATNDIAAYLLGEFDDSDTTQSLSPQKREAQLKAIHHLLDATFVPEVLQAHGLDERFFDAKLKHCNLSRFAIQLGPAMATLLTRLIDGLIAQRDRSNTGIDPESHIVALTRAVGIKILLSLDVTCLNKETAIELGSKLARLFFEKDLLELLMPIDLMEQTIQLWSSDDQSDDQLSKKVYGILKNNNARGDIEDRIHSYDWLPELQGLKRPSDLKIVISRMIATQWLQGRSFWTSEELKPIFKWFGSLSEVGLVDNDDEEDPIEGEYDTTRFEGVFTPSNWKRIELWVNDNIHIHDQRELDIQTAAVLCAFGDQNNVPSELLQKYENVNSDWRAFLWMAEATSWMQTGRQFEYVDKCLDAIIEQIPERAVVIKGLESLNSWIGYWNDAREEFRIRKRIVALDQLIPGAMTHTLLVVVLEHAVINNHSAGFDFFKTFYQSRDQFLHETLVYKTDFNFMHIALSQTISEDTDYTRISLLSKAYEGSIALCAELPDLSDQARKDIQMKLGFWLGRLHFLHPNTSKLKEAIKIWERLAEDFSKTPTMGDVEVMLPVITFLCSAYIRDVLEDPVSANADVIVEKVKALHTVTGFSQDPLTLKLRFRVSLCLARILMARDKQSEAREVLKDDAALAFAMIYQVNNLPLSRIGWFYLSSILTIVDKDRAAWAWTKVAVHQRDRWSDFEIYEEASGVDDNPPLDEALMEKLKDIQKGEEFEFWNGPGPNEITSTFPDDRYLPTYASMACEGRQCRANLTSEDAGWSTHCEPLQIAYEYPWANAGSFSPAQLRPTAPEDPDDDNERIGDYWPRIGIWVCQDCISTKLCEDCYKFRQEGRLPDMGCRADHSGVWVEGSGNVEDPYDEEDDMDDVKKFEADWARQV